MFAIVEFGSLSRGEGDLYSDRDLLVICPTELRKNYLNRYEKEGYSVSLLTEKQLFFMQKKGSLFLQHLKFESRVIFDSNLEYSSFIETCDLFKPTSTEIGACQRSIEYLSKWPNIPLLSAWKADFLFCLSRDYLIKCLAKEGVVAFGLKDIELKSKDIFTLKPENFISLATLRKAKAAYRSDLDIPEDIELSIKNWLTALNNGFDFNNHVAGHKTLDVSYIDSHDFQTPYEQLRTLEALYLVARASGYIHPKHETLINFIQKPNFYRSTQKLNQDKIGKFFV